MMLLNATEVSIHLNFVELDSIRQLINLLSVLFIRQFRDNTMRVQATGLLEVFSYEFLFIVVVIVFVDTAVVVVIGARSLCTSWLASATATAPTFWSDNCRHLWKLWLWSRHHLRLFTRIHSHNYPTIAVVMFKRGFELARTTRYGWLALYILCLFGLRCHDVVNHKLKRQWERLFAEVADLPVRQLVMHRLVLELPCLLRLAEWLGQIKAILLD